MERMFSYGYMDYPYNLTAIYARKNPHDIRIANNDGFHICQFTVQGYQLDIFDWNAQAAQNFLQ